MIKLRMFSHNFAYRITKLLFNENPLIINLKGKLQKPFDFFLRCQTRHIWFAHLLVEISGDFELRELVDLTAIIDDHNNMLKPYMKV